MKKIALFLFIAVTIISLGLACGRPQFGLAREVSRDDDDLGGDVSISKGYDVESEAFFEVKNGIPELTIITVCYENGETTCPFLT